MKNIFVKVRKHTPIPMSESLIKEQGVLYIQDDKFRYLTSLPKKQLIIFDGKNLWYQPELKEKLVIKFSNHPLSNLIFALFNKEDFFKNFKIVKSNKKNDVFYFYLTPKSKESEIEEVKLKVSDHIHQVTLKWKMQDKEQNYYFENIWIKKYIPKSRFQFVADGFEILKK